MSIRLISKSETLKNNTLERGHTFLLISLLDKKCTLGHFLLSMQYAFVPHTFINSIYAIFYYIAMIPHANSVNASLQYANSVIATLPLCQLSTCHETL